MARRWSEEEKMSAFSFSLMFSVMMISMSFQKSGGKEGSNWNSSLFVFIF